MKATYCLFLAVVTSHLLYAQSGASSSQPFTNHVAIGRSGISLNAVSADRAAAGNPAEVIDQEAMKKLP